MKDVEMMEEVIATEVTAKVTKEEKEALINASSDKKIVRYLVDQYYQSQAYRIKAENQARSLTQHYDESDDEHMIFIEKEVKNAKVQESLNKKYMDIVTDAIPVCRWMKSITGIGPVISAYLYAAFDVTIANYNTKFLSYAGLNDNNNPWLGSAKAKEVVNKAIDHRQTFFDEIEEILEDGCDNKTTFKKLISALKKLGKTDEFVFTDIRDTVLSVSGLDIGDYKDSESMIFIVEYVMNLAYPKAADDILYSFVSMETGRGVQNIVRGTNSNWARKKAKTKVPTTDDLESYLAKPPYNTDLKKMMFIIGDLFIKNSGRGKSLYGKIYKDKKLEYIAKNETGEYAERAAQELAEKNYDKNTPTYKRLIEGKLSDAHINARARRYAVKLFISHVFEAMYYDQYHEEPPQTYIIAHGGHHDYIPPEVDYRPYIDGLK